MGCVGLCVIPVGEGPVPRLASKSALSMPSMGKRMGSAHPQDGGGDVAVGWRGFAAVLQLLGASHRSAAGHDTDRDVYPPQRVCGTHAARIVEVIVEASAHGSIKPWITLCKPRRLGWHAAQVGGSQGNFFLVCC